MSRYNRAPWYEGQRPGQQVLEETLTMRPEFDYFPSSGPQPILKARSVKNDKDNIVHELFHLKLNSVHQK
jgi:hypothetical protein